MKPRGCRSRSPLLPALSGRLAFGLALTQLVAAAEPAPGSTLTPAAAGLAEVYVWRDTCNVYLVRDGEAGLLIDLGDGSVLDHLREIGVHRVEWVLFTHHHREQGQGAPRLAGSGARIGAPEAERALFERPLDFRKMQVSLGDAHTIHGASYVRPPITPIRIDRAFGRMDTFTWRGHEIRCVHTPGNSPGGMSYLLRQGDRWLAFSGDVMLGGATMHTWFDTEWDYGFASGIHALFNAAGQLATFEPAWLLPSHGPVLPRPSRELRHYQAKLKHLERLLLRGYDVSTFSAGTQDKLSRPTPVPWLNQISRHLYKFQAPDFFPNFALILADNGAALLVDCGLFDEGFLDQALERAKSELGLKAIDAILVTHMHGDHFLEALHLREKWGCGIWALDRMAPVCEHPEQFDYAAMIQAYGRKFQGQPIRGVRFDRLFRAGEIFDWEGFRFTVDWMPGQTEFALCLNGRIDGRLVAFTGDNLFGDPDDPEHSGHEAVVARNSSILEEGYLYAADYLRRLKPDLLVGGHSYVMDHPAKLIERFHRWSRSMKDAFGELSCQPDYRWTFDPYWVRAHPYRTRVRAGSEVDLDLHLRNFDKRNRKFRIATHAGSGLRVEPAALEVQLPAEKRCAFPLRIRATEGAEPGTQLIGFDLTLDDWRVGQWFDAILEIAP